MSIDFRTFAGIKFKNFLAMAVNVYIISDPLAINFLVDDHIDGFREHLDSDDMLDFGEPEVFDIEAQALAFCAGLGYAQTKAPLPTIIPSARAKLLMLHSLKPSKIIVNSIIFNIEVQGYCTSNLLSLSQIIKVS